MSVAQYVNGRGTRYVKAGWLYLCLGDWCFSAVCDRDTGFWGYEDLYYDGPCHAFGLGPLWFAVGWWPRMGA